MEELHPSSVPEAGAEPPKSTDDARQTPDNAPRPPFPNWVDMLALLGLFLLSSLVGIVGARIAGCEFPTSGGVYPADWGWTVFLSYVVQMTAMVLLTLLYRRIRRGTHRIARFSARGWNPVLLLWGVVLLLAVNIVISPLLELIRFDWLPLPDPGRGLWALLSAVVAAPVLEELLCRGIVLESLRARYGVVTAWLGSSLFFGLIHLQPVMVVNAAVLGLIFAYLYIRTSSLWPCILLHAFNNALALLLMWTEFPGAKFEGRPMAELSLGELIDNPRLYALVYGAALLTALLSAWQFSRKITTLKAGERKNEGADVINPAGDALNSGK